MKSRVQKGNPLVGIIMGSSSDAEHLDISRQILKEFGVAFEFKVVSAHRTPDLMFRYAEEAASRGIEVIIAGAGGAAHLPGMVASKTTLPVIGVPVKSKALSGLDSLLSIVQMPAGVPVATVAIDGAANAALLAIRILAIKHPELVDRLREYREKIERQVLASKV
ncbi:MAG: 5-(carboxyamino)imidazole ribonucleotide mutase [Bacteroidota bacterium]